MNSHSHSDLTALNNLTVAIVGYGSQGRAHALNLRDSNVNVVVGLRPDGASWLHATDDGFTPTTVADAVADADLVALLVPDMAQPQLMKEEVTPNLRAGATVLFAHGFNVHYNALTVPENCDCVLVAPKGPGNLVREEYTKSRGVPCLFAVHHDASGHAEARAVGYASALGGTRAGVLETTFAEETETDLFGEQAVLCGGVTELVQAGWETLVDAGYQPEVAYFECLHELKLIVDLLYEGGFERMHRYVSDTASYGDLSRGPRVVTDAVRENMRTVLREVQDGTFAREWQSEFADGCSSYQALKERDLDHPLETVGRQLRRRMAWLPTEEPVLA